VAFENAKKDLKLTERNDKPANEGVCVQSTCSLRPRYRHQRHRPL